MNDEDILAQFYFVRACGARNSLRRAAALLREGKVDVSCRDALEGNTALGLASLHGHVHIVQWLVQKDACVHTRSGPDFETPFFIACSHGRFEIARLLFSRGANPREKSQQGVTPFWIACACGDLGIARWLAIDVGVDVHEPRTTTRETPLMVAEVMYRCRTVAWLRALLQRRALVAYWGIERQRFRSDSTPLASTTKGAIWGSLPRQAMAEVLLQIALV